MTDPTTAAVETLSMAKPAMTGAASTGSRLPTMICLGWGLGAVTIGMMSNVFNTLVLRFATDYLGVAAGVAGSLLAMSKLYDAFADPMVGAVSDNWKSPQGRRRPFLLAAALLCPLSILALFLVPNLEGAALLTWYVVALILFATAYAVWSVPYLAMSAEMTDDYHDRSRLVSYRVSGGAVGLIISSLSGPLFLAWLGGGRSGYQGMALITGGLIFLLAMTCWSMTRKAPFRTAVPKVKLPLAEQVKMVTQNRPLTLLLGQKAFWYFGFAANQAALAYFLKYVARLPDAWLGWYYLILPPAMILSQPVWLWIAKRVEKKWAMMVAMAIFGILQLSWLLSSPTEPTLIIVVRVAGLGFGAGGTVLLIQSMFNDTIELDSLLTGQRREGAFTGLFSLTEKLFSAIGIASLGAFLGAMGYLSSTGKSLKVQPESAIEAISIGFSVIPFCTALISVLIVSFYNLDRNRLEAARAANQSQGTPA